MIIVIIGGRGMIGHRLWASLSKNHQVFGTTRCDKEAIPAIPNIDRSRIVTNLDVLDFFKLEKELSKIEPDIVIDRVAVEITATVPIIFKLHLFGRVGEHVVPEG